MSTVIIQGLNSRRLVTQGYRAIPRPPSPGETTAIMLRHERTAVDIRLSRQTLAMVHQPTRIEAR